MHIHIYTLCVYVCTHVLSNLIVFFVMELLVWCPAWPPRITLAILLSPAFMLYYTQLVWSCWKTFLASHPHGEPEVVPCSGTTPRGFPASDWKVQPLQSWVPHLWSAVCVPELLVCFHQVEKWARRPVIRARVLRHSSLACPVGQLSVKYTQKSFSMDQEWDVTQTSCCPWLQPQKHHQLAFSRRIYPNEYGIKVWVCTKPQRSTDLTLFRHSLESSMLCFRCWSSFWRRWRCQCVWESQMGLDDPSVT